MAYKNKDKQREANRAAAKRYRAKGMTPTKGIVIPDHPVPVIPKQGVTAKQGSTKGITHKARTVTAGDVGMLKPGQMACDPDRHFKGVAALVIEMAGSESAIVTPKGELIPDSQPLTCRYCGLPLDQPSLQCVRHSQGADR